MVRSKVRLSSIRHMEYGGREYIFYPVCDDGTPENEKFHKATPNGEIKLTVTNPLVFDQWQIGSFYYFDASPVPVPEPTT